MVGRTDDTNQIYEAACAILKEQYHNEPIRLLGLTMTHFEEGIEGQISMFQLEEEQASNKVDQVVDSIRGKFGYGAIQRASLMDKKRPKI